MGQSVAMKINTAPAASFTSKGRWIAPAASFSSISAVGRDAGWALDVAWDPAGAPESSVGRSQETGPPTMNRQANREVAKVRRIFDHQTNAVQSPLLYLPQRLV